MKQFFLVVLGVAGVIPALAACQGNITASSEEPGRGSGSGAGAASGSGAQGGDGQDPPPNDEPFVKPESCASTVTSLGAGKWRRLTQRQYRNTIKDLLGIDTSTKTFLSDSYTGAFATNTLPPQPNDIGAYAASAEYIAGNAVADPAKLTNCNVTAMGNDACAAKFIKEFGARAYRRELSAVEIKTLTDTYNVGKADGLAQGLQLVLQSMLQSPSFLYLAEYGGPLSNGVAKLTSSEVGNRLSYLLWNTMPDATLLAAAKAGELDTVQGVQAQAERLMKDPRFAGALGDFHIQLFHLNRLTDGTRVQKVNAPEFDATMRQAMLDEVNAFVGDAFANERATVKTLFTAPYAFPSGPLLGIYKVTAAQLSNGRYEVKDGSRAGLLTSPALMAAEPPTPTPYAVVQRGKMVRTTLLCDELPPPPPDLKFLTPPDAATTPQRALLDQHKNDPSCAGCHTMMDPIGFAFENYDALGRYRTNYPKGEIVDPSGEILGETDVDGEFRNVTELAAKLGDSAQVRACLGTHWFRYSYGREPTADDTCVIESFAEALSVGDGDLPTSLLSFVASDAFRFRRGVE